MHIELAHVIPVSEVNGPGKRSVIWVQGCRKRCKGCWNPDFLKFGSDWRLTPMELFTHLLGLTNEFTEIEGITFSGGEPFEQARAISEAAKLFRQEGLGIMSYSGYTKEEIVSLGHSSLLDQLDILVDGEYIEEQKSDLLWRSSTNQRVHFLTSRYEPFKDRTNMPIREFEVVITADDIRITGFPESSG